MNGSHFRLWQVDRHEYEAVCAHLGLQPQPGVFERLDRHLATLAVTQAPPGRLARALALPPLTRARLARLDIATRLFFPRHPVRHVINAVVALHECTPAGYRQLSRPVHGAALAARLAGGLAGAALRLALALPWLGLACARAALWPRPGTHADVAGRRVLITGVARGLGHDLMLECLERGAQVVGTVRTQAARQALLAALPAQAAVQVVVADLAQPDALAAALAAQGVSPDSVDTAVLCAATKHRGHSVLDLPRLRETLQVNVLACAEAAAWLLSGPAPGLRSLVVVSSLGRWHGMPRTAGYNASKAALAVWAESLEMELARQRAAPRLTVVEPGLFASGMSGTGRLHALLATPRRSLARQVLDAAARGRASLCSPWWFAAATALARLAGRGARARVFSRVGP